MKVIINYEGNNLEMEMAQVPRVGDYIAGVLIAYVLGVSVYSRELDALQNLDFPVEKVVWSGFSMHEQYVFIELGTGVE